MIRIAFTALALLLPLHGMAENLTGSHTYWGRITGVAVGFRDHVGVSLVEGTTCNGLPYVLLQTDNPKYSEILGLLTSAVVNNKEVQIPNVGAELASDGSGICVISDLSLGRFSAW